MSLVLFCHRLGTTASAVQIGAALQHDWNDPTFYTINKNRIRDPCFDIITFYQYTLELWNVKLSQLQKQTAKKRCVYSIEMLMYTYDVCVMYDVLTWRV